MKVTKNFNVSVTDLSYDDKYLAMTSSSYNFYEFKPISGTTIHDITILDDVFNTDKDKPRIVQSLSTVEASKFKIDILTGEITFYNLCSEELFTVKLPHEKYMVDIYVYRDTGYEKRYNVEINIKIEEE